MLKSKKIIAMLTVVVFLFTVLAVNSFAETSISLKLDGKVLSLSTKPMNKNGEVYIPVKPIAEAIGGTAILNSVKQMTVKTAEKTTVLTVNSTKAIVNKVSINLKNPVITFRGTFMIPLSSVKDVLGADAVFASGTVEINYFTILTGTLKIGGSTTIQQYAQSIADKLLSMNKTASISVTGGGSGAGVKGAIDGTFNIGNASRDLTAAEKAGAPDLISYMIGKDAIVVIVNKANTVKALTKDQVKQIFTGKIVNWKDVGGADAPILVQTREEGSGTLDGMKTLALGGANVVATATPLTSTDLVREAVKNNANAIGYISMGYINSTITGVKIGGVTATPINSMSGRYPYVRNLNVVTKGQPSEMAAKYINFMLSPEGQKMLSDEAYLPLKLKD
jgi:phosphate transport system substrate-binding protein